MCNGPKCAFSLCFRAMSYGFASAFSQKRQKIKSINVQLHADMSLIVVTFVLFLVCQFPSRTKCLSSLRACVRLSWARLFESSKRSVSCCNSPYRVCCATKCEALSFLSASLGSAAAASAETGLQAVDEVADDGEDEKEDDDNDRDDDVAGHFGGIGGVVGWVEWLTGSEAWV